MKLPFEALLKGKFASDKTSVGIDIGVSSIKVIKLKFPKSVPTLSDFKLAPVTLQPEEALKKMIDPKECEGVNISVAGPATLIRYINFPKMDSEELKQAMKFEAQKHIPFPISEINLDSFILKDNLPDNKMLILLAVVKKDFMNQRLKLIEGAGFKVRIVEICSASLINAFNYNYAGDEAIKTKTTALLNIGAAESNLNILENGVPSLSRDIHMGGNNFTQKLVEALGLDFKAAENLKVNPDKEKSSNIAMAVEQIIANLASEIRISFDFYESQAASSVSKIFLSGGASMLAGLKESLAGLLGIEVDYWDPLKKIGLAPNVDASKIKALSCQLAVAAGLALHA